MRRKLIVIIFISILFDKTCFADNHVTQISRYLTATNKPTFSQTHLLSQSIQVHFTQNIKTIGDAMNYLLHFSGYALIAEAQRTMAFQTILSKPLPTVHRELGPMTLRNGLTTLSGSAFYLWEDPVNRVIDFKLKPEYQKFMHPNQTSRSKK